eukprot:g30936.t1
MEYCVQFWLPNYRKEVIALERVQIRFTRMLPRMTNLSYEERQDRLGLHSLIEVDKIMRDIDSIDHEKLFPLVNMSKTGEGISL